MKSKRAYGLTLLGVLAGAIVAVSGGFAQLSCGSTPAVLSVVAGSFGAGAALTALVAEYRSSRAIPQA